MAEEQYEKMSQQILVNQMFWLAMLKGRRVNIHLLNFLQIIAQTCVIRTPNNMYQPCVRLYTGMTTFPVYMTCRFSYNNCIMPFWRLKISLTWYNNYNYNYNLTRYDVWVQQSPNIKNVTMW
jgi:hypothetical protein